MFDLSNILIPPTASIRETITCIDRNGKGIALVVDEERRLLGTVTDGDIRRAILSNLGLDEPVQALLDRRSETAYPKPITALIGDSDPELLELMQRHSVRHVPVVDRDGRVADLAVLSDLLKEERLPLTAVVMAGGFGTRLRPLTQDMPKPMLPVGDRPLLEVTIERLRKAGIHRVHLTTHYKKDVIAQHFGDGRSFGVEINYVPEEQPLGTAGGLSGVPSTDEPILVINGDILTDLDFRAMLDFHREQDAVMTIAVHPEDFQVPFGVIEQDGVQVTSMSEKPLMRLFVNAGIYLLNPEVLESIPRDRPSDMPEVISGLLAAGKRVVSFPIHEHWQDIGEPHQYKRAQAEMDRG